MNLLQEIRNSFAQVRVNSALKIKCEDVQQFDTWVIRQWDWLGVGILNVNDVIISETFSNARLFNLSMTIGNQELNLIIFASDNEELRNEFATVCAEFCHVGDHGLHRKQIQQDPLSWWNRWRQLLGNTVTEKKSYSVLAELLIFEQLLKRGEKASWTAQINATHDIQTENESFEVKATIKRYGSTFTVSSEFQLTETAQKLFIIFCRFEESEHGINIDDIVKRLVELGSSKEKLEQTLKRYELEVGRKARNIRYIVHEVIQYTVDENFPRITAESFIGGKFPTGIENLKYEVDLDSIVGSRFEIM